MLRIEKDRRFNHLLIRGLLIGDEKHSITLHHSEQTSEADRPWHLSFYPSDAHTDLRAHPHAQGEISVIAGHPAASCAGTASPPRCRSASPARGTAAVKAGREAGHLIVSRRS